MDDIEEEGRYLTGPTQHPSMQMHLEIDDGRVAIILENSILIFYMIPLFAFTRPLAHNRRLARPLFLIPVGTNRPPLHFLNCPCKKFDALLFPACVFLLLLLPINIHLIASDFRRPFLLFPTLVPSFPYCPIPFR